MKRAADLWPAARRGEKFFALPASNKFSEARNTTGKRPAQTSAQPLPTVERSSDAGKGSLAETQDFLGAILRARLNVKISGGSSTATVYLI
jgi:hypothetical protein